MKTILASMMMAGLAMPALAQQADPDRIVRPYWWDRPVVEVVGRGEREAAPNRASFSASFVETDKEPEKALRRATDRAAAAVQAMRRELGATARISSNVTNRPYFQQYRDKENKMVNDDRPDRVQGYEARATLSVEVLDAAAAGRARAAALAVGLERSSRLIFRLEETPAMQQEMMRSAAQDARARAQAAATAAGATLGDLLVLQEGQGQCLGGWGSRQVATQVAQTSPPTPGGYGNLNLMNGRRLGPGPAIPEDALQAVEVLQDGAFETYGAGAVGGVANFVTRSDIERFDLDSDPAPIRIGTTVCAVYALR